jgi:DNA replication protein DnaC
MSSSFPQTVVQADGSFCRARFATEDWACPLCAGRGGSYGLDEEGYEVWKICECKKHLRRQELFNAAGIGRRYASATLESYEARTLEQQKAVQFARDFTLMYPSVAGGLLFWGPVGTGKTHLAVGIFRELTLRKGVACRFIDYGNLLQDLRRSFSNSSGDSALMIPLVEVELLVIDELGKGRGTEWEETVLDDLISRRYNAGKITLCTTNFEPRDDRAPSGQGVNAAYEARSGMAARSGKAPTLRERVGDRIYSRLCEMCEFVQVGGGDYRRTAQDLSRRGR